MLTKKQLKQLRNEISLNSLFLKDYSNSLFIKEKTVCSFFDSFIEYLYDNYDLSGLDLYDVLEKYDNIDELYEYYLSFEYDPLIQDDYIAYYNDLIYAGMLIYEVQYGIDDSVLCASYFMKNGYMVINKITKNKIYYDKQGDTYIKKYNHRYYLKDFIKNI